MTTSTQSTLVLLLFAFVAFKGIRYWRRLPYGSKVGLFTWITHRGILLSYMPGFAALTTQHSCQVPPEGSPRHALCHIPFLCRERTFVLFAVAAVLLWTSTLIEALLFWKPGVGMPYGKEKQRDYQPDVEATTQRARRSDW